MSMIANGVVFKTTDVFELHEHIMDWNKRVVALTKHAYAKLYAQGITKIIDDAAADGKPIPGNPSLTVYRDVDKQQREIVKTQLRNPRYDFEFSMSILPYQGKLYGIISCEQREWEKEFRARGIADDFFYDNRTDRPRNIRAADWKHRAEVWDGISHSFQFGPGAGFRVTCTAQSPYAQPDDQSIIALILTKKERAATVAKDRLFGRHMELDEKLQKAKLDAAEIGEGGVPSHAIMGAFRRFEEWAKTEGGKCVLALEAGHVYSLLPDITVDML